MTATVSVRTSSTASSGTVETFVFRPAALLNAGLVLGLLLAFCSLVAAEVPPSEYQVEAAYLLNFPKFIEWPPAAFETPDSPLAICILGDDPFGNVLDQLVKGEIINGRRLTVQRLRHAPTPKSCQVLFVNKSEHNLPEVLSGLGPGVLTVGERDKFLRDGGIIAFVLEGRHVRFDINQHAAAEASLRMNARLLSVARSVRK